MVGTTFGKVICNEGTPRTVCFTAGALAFGKHHHTASLQADSDVGGNCDVCVHIVH